MFFLLSLLVSDCANKPETKSRVDHREKIKIIQSCLSRDDFRQAAVLFREIENKISKDKLYFNIMYELALYSDNIDLRESYTKRLLKAAKNDKFPEYRRGSLYANLADLKKEKGELDSAKSILKEALSQTLDPASERSIECYAKPLSRLNLHAPRLKIHRWLNTDPISAAELQGKTVLLDFWSPGCFPCRQLFPRLQKLHQQYQQQGLVIITITRLSRRYSDDLHHKVKVTLEEGVELTKQFLSRHGISVPAGLVTDAILFDDFGVLGFPTLFLINQKGTIVDFKLGGDYFERFEKKIRSLLMNQDKISE